MAIKLYNVVIRTRNCPRCQRILVESRTAYESKRWKRFNELREERLQRENCSDCTYVTWRRCNINRMSNLDRYHPSWVWYKIYERPNKKKGETKGPFVDKVWRD